MLNYSDKLMNDLLSYITYLICIPSLSTINEYLHLTCNSLKIKLFRKLSHNKTANSYKYVSTYEILKDQSICIK